MAIQLQNKALLRHQGYIDGRFVDADSGARFGVDDPATGERLAEVADMGKAETRRAIDAAHRALPAWRAKTAKERAAILRRWNDLLLANTEDLARLMTAEQGKPLAESRGEVAYGASFIEWFAEEGKRAYGTSSRPRGTTVA
jgi:succinate-semialdehyde dehydrogenase/glutarate-semialdehyde dehydrogenase